MTDITMAENSYLEMDTVQLGGVDSTMRKTTAVLAAGARLVVRERLMTTGSEWARSDFDVTLEGEDSGVDLISRSVARGNSRQEFNSCLRGKNRCSGHSECDAILAESGSVIASPSLEAAHVDAALIHEGCYRQNRRRTDPQTTHTWSDTAGSRGTHHPRIPAITK